MARGGAARRFERLDFTERVLSMGITRAMTRFLLRYGAEVTKAVAGAPDLATSSPEMLIALGDAQGWWEESVDAELLSALVGLWEDVMEAEDVKESSLTSAIYYISGVRDRLVRGLTPGLPEDAMNTVRISLAEGAMNGWTRDRQSLDIAKRLGWDFDGDYWRERLDEANGRIDSVLDKYGPRGSRERMWARLNDAEVNLLQQRRNAAIARLDSLKSHWAVRAELIARTEATGFYNAAALQALINEGAVGKRWMATTDERTRETHRNADDQIVGIFDPFTVGDAKMLFPGDPNGGAAEVCNCRCTLVGVSVAEYVEATGGGPYTPPPAKIEVPIEITEARWVDYAPEEKVGDLLTILQNLIIASAYREPYESLVAAAGQPRAPKGTSIGGQWIKAGGGAAAAASLNAEEWVGGYQRLSKPETAEEATDAANPWRVQEQGGVDYFADNDPMLNCQMAVTTWEMRQRGLDVIATKGQGGADGTDAAWTNWFEYQDHYATLPKPSEVARGTKTISGISQTWAREVTGVTDVVDPVASHDALTRVIVDKAQMPPGSRGFVTMRWSSTGAGHIMGWERPTSGPVEVMFYDPQTGKIGYDTIKAKINFNDRIDVARTDNARFGFGNTRIKPPFLPGGSREQILRLRSESFARQDAYQQEYWPKLKRRNQLEIDLKTLKWPEQSDAIRVTKAELAALSAEIEEGVAKVRDHPDNVRYRDLLEKLARR